jgi:hypothetical protein
MNKLALAAILALPLAVIPLAAEARPFRAMVTRTADTTENLELGLRYQGFLAGNSLNALDYHQVSPGVRLGLLEDLELNVYFDLMVVGTGGGTFEAYLGDIPVGLQLTFLESRLFAMGVWVRGTIPVGTQNFERLPSSLTDRVPPTISDGTWDAEGTLIAELRPTREFRIMANLGYLYHGVRSRGPDPDFDLPDAVRYDLAATLNLGDWFLLGVELTGRSFFDPQITPAWDDNAHQLEVIPHARFEVVPNLVLEAALGFALTDDLQEIYRLRGLLGFTYEFDLGGGGDEERPARRSRGRGKKRGH